MTTRTPTPPTNRRRTIRVRGYDYTQGGAYFITVCTRDRECLLGKVTLENEFLKKAIRNNLKRTEKKESSLPKIAPLSKAFKGGANS